MCDFVDGMDACSSHELPRSKSCRESSRHQRSFRPSGCRQKKKEDRICQSERHVGECPHLDKYSDLSSSESSGRLCRDCATEARLKAGRSDILRPELDINSIMNLKQEVYTQPRHCPICYTDISWLPKYGTCPKCCYKPVPIITEKPYDENQTAADILAEWGTSNTVNQSKSSKNKCQVMRENRCKCSDGNICAFCRIQNMCSDILGKTWKSTKLQSASKKKSDFELCKSSDNEDTRPHLQRVISELKDLYDISKEEKVDLNPNKEQECMRLIGGSELKTKKKSMCGIIDVPVASARKLRRA